MNRTVSVSELALNEIYKALDGGKEHLNKKTLDDRSKKSHREGLTSSPSRLMNSVKALAPNFGVKVED